MNRYEEEQWVRWAKHEHKILKKEEMKNKRERNYLVRVRNRIIRGIREDAERCDIKNRGK